MTATPHYEDDSVTLFHGDCLDVLRELADCSVDSIVTDPPYGLGFMGREWDALPPGLPWAQECLRVLKPGGHLLAFGGTRTWHRLAVAVEDAGFEVRDSIAWLYGSGFPKSLDVSKALDKAAGAEREVTATERSPFRMADKYMGDAFQSTQSGDSREVDADGYIVKKITAPATPEAARWQGWGTALKPAFEPIVVARKPLAGTVAANVLAHGTGALNVDGCRTGTTVETWPTSRGPNTGTSMAGGVMGQRETGDAPAGRWPANVLLDDSQAAELDRQVPSASTNAPATWKGGTATREGWGNVGKAEPGEVRGGYGDSGGASRFFPTFRYEAKAPTAERPSYVSDGAGTGRLTGLGGKVRQCNVCETRAIESGAGEPSCGHGDFRWEEPTRDSTSRVAHPTVKPLDLMRWLVRLVTPPGGTVLEPFAGSGTTAEACVIEGFHCIAVEREASYLPLIVARLSKPIQPDLFGGAA